MVKIGAELPMLFQKYNWVFVFWTTLYVHYPINPLYQDNHD